MKKLTETKNTNAFLKYQDFESLSFLLYKNVTSSIRDFKTVVEDKTYDSDFRKTELWCLILSVLYKDGIM